MRSVLIRCIHMLFVRIMFQYLICNGFALFVTAWEQLDRKTLLTTQLKFYTYASDIISVLAVFSCAIRLPTYIICDVTFRKEIQWILCGYSRRFSRDIMRKREIENSRIRSESIVSDNSLSISHLPPKNALRSENYCTDSNSTLNTERRESIDLGGLMMRALLKKQYEKAQAEHIHPGEGHHPPPPKPKTPSFLAVPQSNVGGFRGLARAAIEADRKVNERLWVRQQQLNQTGSSRERDRQGGESDSDDQRMTFATIL